MKRCRFAILFVMRNIFSHNILQRGRLDASPDLSGLDDRSIAIVVMRCYTTNCEHSYSRDAVLPCGGDVGTGE
jgi:hypothetical protein